MREGGQASPQSQLVLGASYSCHTKFVFSPTDASDLQGRQLLAGLDKVASDLDRQEKAITAIVRPPLEQGRAIEDSTERAKDLKVLPGWGSGWALDPLGLLLKVLPLRHLKTFKAGAG